MNKIKLNPMEKKIIYFLLENPSWHSALRIGVRVGKKCSRNASSWTRNNITRLVRDGLVTYIASSSTYRVKTTVVMPFLNGKREKIDSNPIEYFITKQQGNNNRYIATR